MTEKLIRLELTWPGKEDRFNPEPRILLEDKEKSFSYEPTEKGAVEPTYDNMLIHGDNLLALKALEQDYTGKVKCIYIDPPYNTGNAFEHYDDGLEHSIWLSLMRDRLEILKRLLAEDGSIWITLDDNEQAYCKVLCDEIFGRNNFVGTVIWEKADSPRMDVQFFSTRHDYILVFAKNIINLLVNREENEEIPEHYNKTDKNGRRYYLKPLRVMGGNISESLFYPLFAPDGAEILPYDSHGVKSCWRWSKKKVQEEAERIEWVAGKNGWSPYFRIYADSRKGMPIQTIWTHEEAGSNRTSKKEINDLFKDNTFATPKPEKLIQKVLKASTNPGDLVLDSFLGSGTTAAVAHKMGRRWIGVEMGDHVYTHCIPRLQKVIKGEDAGGVTKSTGWLCGGGFKFYELASSLIIKDKYGQQIISDKYNADMLAEAMCKILGYHYKPDAEKYWKQGFSSEKSFIYTTTMSVQEESLDKLAAEVGDDNLLICCSAFVGNKNAFPNITVKKIPSAILKKCEWGREGYPLNLKDYKPTDEEFEFEEEGNRW